MANATTTTKTAKPSKQAQSGLATTVAQVANAVTANASVTAQASVHAAKAAVALAAALQKNPLAAQATSGLENVAPSFAVAHMRGYGKPLPTTYIRAGVTYNCPNGFVTGTNKTSPKNGSADHQLFTAMHGAYPVGQVFTLAQAAALGLQPHNIKVWLQRGWLVPA